MAKDGRVKTSYNYDEILFEPHIHVLDKNTGKDFYIVYVNHCYLGKAINKIRRSKTLSYLESNYKKF
jgi:hypothetical protein